MIARWHQWIQTPPTFKQALLYLFIGSLGIVSAAFINAGFFIGSPIFQLIVQMLLASVTLVPLLYTLLIAILYALCLRYDYAVTFRTLWLHMTPMIVPFSILTGYMLIWFAFDYRSLLTHQTDSPVLSMLHMLLLCATFAVSLFILNKIMMRDLQVTTVHRLLFTGLIILTLLALWGCIVFIYFINMITSIS